MSIGEEKKVEAYGEEDRELLISLLNEYSEKLVLVSKRIDTQSRRLLSYTIAVTAALCLTISATAILIDHWKALSQEFSPALIITFMATIATYSMYGSFQIIIYRGEKEILFRDAKAIAKRLEKVVQIGSQMHEHSENRVVSRIEMDLRLTDAEIALDHYESIRKRLHSYSWRDFLGDLSD
jgi:hypothetical protein